MCPKLTEVIDIISFINTDKSVSVDGPRVSIGVNTFPISNTSSPHEPDWLSDHVLICAVRKKGN